MAEIQTKTDEQTIALAGVAQCCKQVRSIATSGYCDEDILATAISSILNTSPENTEAVYGKKSALYAGLNIIKHYHFSQQKQDIELTRLIIYSLALSNKLLKRKDLLAKLDSGIEQAKLQQEHFELLHENIRANLAGLYKETISTLTPKIMVPGHAVHLEASNNANTIRTLLLAAVRSGVLWHQLGGSKWQLLFSKRKYIEAAQRLLKI